MERGVPSSAMQVSPGSRRRQRQACAGALGESDKTKPSPKLGFPTWRASPNNTDLALRFFPPLDSPGLPHSKRRGSIFQGVAQGG